MAAKWHLDWQRLAQGLPSWADVQKKPIPKYAELLTWVGKRWLLLSRWVNLDGKKQQLLNDLFRLNRRMMKAYLLKESLDRLWTYQYEGAALRYLNQWIDQLRWQRLEPFKKLAAMLLRHLEGILNYCRVKVPFGVVEAVNGNIKSLLRRGRGYKNLRYLLLKAQRMAALKTEFVVFRKAA